jgi:glucose-6-phosphate 1-dehydrogenase
MSQVQPTTNSVHLDNQLIMLFGATGDLARRKILPGLFHLSIEGLMPERYRILGSSPNSVGMTSESFRKYVLEAVKEFGAHKPTSEQWKKFSECLIFAVADADKDEGFPEIVAAAEAEIGGPVHRLIHLAVPPDAVLSLVQMISNCGLNENARVICEKPFGVDLASAKTLNRALLACFKEESIFRIDHFLGKESIDNILALRFANRLFEPLWNRDHVSFVQIDVPESLSVAGRGAFYEKTGAYRDMVVTHLLQVLGYLAMEQPSSLNAKPLRDEVAKVFEALKPIDPTHVVRGQYGGYRKEAGVARDSQVETFVAMRVEVENTRWKGVPFYLRTGKCLGESRQVITIGFHEPVMRLFPRSEGPLTWRGNKITVDFEDPGTIRIEFLAKRPGTTMQVGPADMTFEYDESFQSSHNLEAYEHLIYEAMLGNRALFTRSDGIERLWEISAPLLERPRPVEIYKKGSWGPSSIDDVVGHHGWCLP